MEKVIQIASYISERYLSEFSVRIDEMKLHKLLYLVQRESLIQLGRPAFDESFEAWRYGPVMVCLRSLYASDGLHQRLPDPVACELKPVFDEVFSRYASRSSWSLSDLTHGDSSWRIARKGLARDAAGHVPMSIDDIRRDAEYIKMRRRVMPVIRSLLKGGSVENN